MVAIGVSAAAIMIIFSVCNGLISLVKDQYKAFYPDVRISVARGKFFPVDTTKLATLKKIKGVQGITTVIVEQNAIRALNLASRAIILDTGTVVFDGTAREVLDNNELRAEYLAI